MADQPSCVYSRVVLCRHRGWRVVTAALTVAVLGLVACTNDDGPKVSASRGTDKPSSSQRVPPDRPTTSSDGDTDNKRAAESRLSQLPAFANVPWADAMKAEQDAYSSLGKPSSAYGPLSLPDTSGTYLNVVNHERVTRHARCDGCPRKVVWFSGNSAAFGYGQRDDHTIASELSQLGADAGIDLEVRNLGQPGTAFFDELPWIESHLKVDPQPPDLVVLYDGFNDVLQCYMYAVMRDGGLLDPVTYYDQPTAVEFQKLDPPPDLDAALVPKVAAHTAAEFRDTQARLNAMLGARGIPSAHFFQPDAFVSPLQAEGLAKSLNRTMADLIGKNNLAKLLEQTADQLEPGVHNLRPLAADFTEPVFADPAHMNEAGARLVAEAIFPTIEPLLRP